MKIYINSCLNSNQPFNCNSNYFGLDTTSSLTVSQYHNSQHYLMHASRGVSRTLEVEVSGGIAMKKFWTTPFKLLECGGTPLLKMLQRLQTSLEDLIFEEGGVRTPHSPPLSKPLHARAFALVCINVIFRAGEITLVFCVLGTQFLIHAILFLDAYTVHVIVGLVH